jgi:hypothetical protein
MIRERNAGKNQTLLNALAYPETKNRRLPGRMIGWQVASVNHDFSRRGETEKNSFLSERSRNVVENKGPLWKTWERSGNVHENTGG